jgi:hypothetical protein
MKPKLILGLALVLSGGLFGLSNQRKTVISKIFEELPVPL